MKRLVLTFAVAMILAVASTGRAYDATATGRLSWHLSVGSGVQKGAGSNLHLLAGTGFSLGVGQHLYVDMIPIFASIVSKGGSGGSYLIDAPISLCGSFRVSESVLLSIGGGIGIGFSDMRAWEKSNRALTGHLSLSLSLHDGVSKNLASELRLAKASTSTGNATLGYLLFRYSVGI